MTIGPHEAVQIAQLAQLMQSITPPQSTPTCGNDGARGDARTGKSFAGSTQAYAANWAAAFKKPSN